MAEPALFDLDAMFPGLENLRMRYVLHLCGLRDIDPQTRLIEYEGLENVEDLANYTDAELDSMADRNSKRSPVNTRVQMGLARTKTLKAITLWVRKKVREGADCDLHELSPVVIAELIRELGMPKKDADTKLYYPEKFVANEYKTWIKKVENYLDSRIGKAGVPLSYVIRAADANPMEAPDEYTRALWAASFDTPQYTDDNREVYHLFTDLLTNTDGATWFEKVKDGDGRAAHMLLREHYVGEAHDMRRAAAANAKLESLYWKNEAAYPFEKYLTRMNEAFKELEDAGQPLYPAQQVNFLLKNTRSDNVQVQTTLGIIRDRYLTDFDAACLTLSRTISSCFPTGAEGRNKRSIGATTTNPNRSAGRGRGRGTGGRGSGGNSRPRVVMNGVDVTDISRNFTSAEWEKLKAVGGHTYIYQRREYLSGRGSGRSDGRGGGRGGRGRTGNRNHGDAPRAVAAASTTAVVEYDADRPNAQEEPANGERGGRSGGRFGPRRVD